MVYLNGKFPAPNGFYKTTKEWYQAYTEIFGIANTFYKELEYEVELFDELMFQPNPIIRPVWSGGASVSLMPNGRVYGENGIVITPDNKLLWDVSFEWFTEPSEHSIFFEDGLPSPIKVDETCAVLTHLDSFNYFHWMFEVLPRIQLIQRSGISIDKYILNYTLLPFQIETLKLLNIPKNKIIQVKKDTHIQASRLVVPSIPDYASSWSCEYLRNKLLNGLDPKKNEEYERIYISRLGRRIIINEDDLMKVLEKHNFKKILLENLSVQEQIRLFSSAKFIIGAHGAGLTNLAFCKQGTKVIEIFPAEYLNPLYWLISNFVKADYYHIIGERQKLEAPRFDNIVLDIKKFSDKIEQIIR